MSFTTEFSPFGCFAKRLECDLSSCEVVEFSYRGKCYSVIGFFVNVSRFLMICFVKLYSSNEFQRMDAIFSET